MDIQTRKILTTTCNHHPRSAVEWLCLPQGIGGLGLVNVENLLHWRLVTLACQVCSSCDSLVVMCRKLDGSLSAHRSVIRISDWKILCSLELSFECNSCDSIRNTICKKQLHSLTLSILAKPLHGRFYSFVNTVDVETQKRERTIIDDENNAYIQ